MLNVQGTWVLDIGLIQTVWLNWEEMVSGADSDYTYTVRP